MRGLSVISLLTGALVIASAALADEIDGGTLDRVFAVATRDYPDPASAVMRNVHKSRALNDQGYCGEVTVASGGGFTVFHVLLESTTGPSVLLLSDFPESDQGANATTVRQMMRNFGCVE